MVVVAQTIRARCMSGLLQSWNWYIALISQPLLPNATLGEGEQSPSPRRADAHNRSILNKNATPR